jgi:hypothetical protein
MHGPQRGIKSNPVEKFHPNLPEKLLLGKGDYLFTLLQIESLQGSGNS